MKWNRFRSYMFLEGAVVLTVILLFKAVEEKRVAALIAGMLFVLSSFGILLWEIRKPKFHKGFTLWGTLFFLVCAAFPVLVLRLTYWDMPFELLSLFGISGPQWHRFSNYAFAVMIVSFFVDSMITQKKQAELEDPANH